MLRKDVDRILRTMLRSSKGVSDLNMSPGRPLQVESSGKLVEVPIDPPAGSLTPYQTEMLALGVVGSRDRGNLESLIKTGSVDCAYELPGECRFRVNVFQQRQQYSMVLRKLESTIMSLDDLGLPDIFRTMSAEKNGLILVTGATGSGKSTTLAAMLNEMNETRPIHILTIEDPIEYVHPHKKATFNQRELGTDFDTFQSSLRAALRQAPKVILVGEIRDRETLEMALSAASTGHLVLSTLHSIDCGQTINRIVGMFEKEEEDQIRSRLVECLRYVVNQRLLPKKGGGRVACQEIMGINLRIKEVLLNGETEGKSFYDIIGQARNRGWQTHDQAITDLFGEDKITEETAVAYASNRPILNRMLDRLKQERGIQDDDALKLSLDGSASEAKDLIKQAWPSAGTPFPKQKPYGVESSLVLYEPGSIDFKGGAAELFLPFKVQGTLNGLRAMNPSGSVIMTAQSKGGSDGPMLTLAGWNITAITIVDNETPKKLAEELKGIFSEILPQEIEVPNPRFTQAKRDALARLCDIGKLNHLQQLRSFMERATDEAEVQAIDDTIKAIEARQ